MPVLFVLCDTDAAKRGQGASLAAVLEECGESLPVSEYSYVIKTNHSADEVYASLQRRIGSRLWVFTVPEPYTGQAPASVKQWLEEVGNRYASNQSDSARR